jgi:spoIIIJ-associated protein
MKSLEIGAKTVQEAVQKGLKQLGLTEADAEIEILSEPSSGLFGLIGSRQALVRISEKNNPERHMISFIAGIIEKMGLSGSVEVTADAENLVLDVSGSGMGVLIGRRGQTLNSLQYLLNVVYHKNFPGDNRRILLDVEDYRRKREQTLRQLAERIAKSVAMYGREVVLEPMNPQERRIIHTALQGNPAVATYSQGEEPYRKVVIAPK